MTSDFNNIREWLLPKLNDKHMSVEMFARACGLSRAAVYFYLNDKHRPTPETMATMCGVLDVPFEEGLAQYTDRPVGRPELVSSRFRRNSRK